MKIFFTFFFSLACFQLATAKQFKNAYVSFDIPDRWNCALEATEWVCRSQETNESKEAIIVLTAKEVGAYDSLQIYFDHVKNPIMGKNKQGQEIPSKVMSPPSFKKINNLDWVDGFHESSEVQNYYTRYVATIKGTIAVLITFSAHKEFYSKYSSDFFKAINSLNVIATKIYMQDTGSKAESSLNPIPASSDGEMIPGLDPSVSQGPKKSNKLIFIIGAVIFAAIGLLLLMRKKKKS